MLSRFVVAFLPRSKHLLLSWLQSPSAVILEPKKIKSVTVSSVSHLFAMKWWDRMPCLRFLNVEFEASLFTLLFHFRQEALLFFLLSAISVISSAYLNLLIFLPAILIPTCASFSLAFHMIFSAYKLNKLGNSIQPWRTPFPIWNQSVVPCPVLTVASWPAYRFLKRQGLVFPSLSEFSTVYCDPHIQRLWHSQ